MSLGRNDQRDLYLDIVKGVGIVCVYIGHSVGQASATWRLIYFFHMPLFFLLSGMLFRPEKFGSWCAMLKKTFVSLMIPYFVFMILANIIKADIMFPKWTSNFAQEIYRAFGYGYAANGLWFFTCLTMVRIIAFSFYLYGIEKSIAKQICVLFTVALLGEIANFVEMSTSFRFLPFMLMSVPAALLFFLFGRYAKDFLKRTIGMLCHKNLAIILAFVTGACLIVIVNFTRIHSYNIAHSEFSICGLVPCFLGLLFVFSLARIIVAAGGGGGRGVAYIGMNSIIFFPMEYNLDHLLELSGFCIPAEFPYAEVWYVVARTLILLSCCAICVPALRFLLKSVQDWVNSSWRVV